MSKRNHWLKIDNAGKIFPAVSNDSRSSTFRLSMYINENVDKDLLEKVVNNLLPRFDTFNVKLKRGLFWNYLATNNNHFKVEEETSIIGQYRLKSTSLFCFRVLYFEKRITLETFHSLSDGTGAMEFLKSIVYEYLKEKGYELENEGKIYSEKIINPYEYNDAFTLNYDKNNRLSLKEETAYKLKGELYPNNFNRFIKVTVNMNEFMNLVHKNNVSATQYLTALLLYSIYKNDPNAKRSKKPIKIFVPVNLRRFFEVNTLRNFALYIKVTINPLEKEYTFEDILNITIDHFNKQLNKEELLKRINANVYFEKNWLIRIMPLFIKNIGFKIGYFLAGSRVSTSYISNLGKIDAPSSMLNYVSDVDFVNAGENLYLTVASIKDRVNLIFSTRLVNSVIIYDFIKTLQKEGLDIVVHSNFQGD